MGNFLVIGMLGGFHIAVVKYLAEDAPRTKEILSTALWSILGLTLVSVGALYAAMGPLAAALRIDPQLFAPPRPWAWRSSVYMRPRHACAV